MTPRPTPAEIAALRRFVAREAARSEQGRRRLALVRAHEARFMRAYAARPALQRATDRALARAAEALERREEVVSDELVADVEGVLEELGRTPDRELVAAADEVRRALRERR